MMRQTQLKFRESTDWGKRKRVRLIIIHLLYCLTRMVRKYNVFKDSVTTLAKIIPSYYMGEGFSSDTPCAGGCGKGCFVASLRNLTVGFD